MLDMQEVTGSSPVSPTIRNKGLREFARDLFFAGDIWVTSKRLETYEDGIFTSPSVPLMSEGQERSGQW